MLSFKKNTKGQRSYDYIYMAFTEYTNPERLNINSWLKGPGVESDE